MAPLRAVGPHRWSSSLVACGAAALGRGATGEVWSQGLRGSGQGDGARPEASAPPSGTRAPGAADPSVWTVEGPCRVDASDRDCVTSPHFPRDYQDSESCRMSVAEGQRRYLEVLQYEAEPGYDMLVVDGEEYRAAAEWHEIAGEIRWTSDQGFTAGGWKICARTSVPEEEGPWRVRGPCQVDPSDRDCVESPHYPAAYPDLQSCVLTLAGAGEDPRRQLEVTALRVETCCDNLTMGGQRLSMGDAGRYIEEPITWASDEGVSASGWRLCARHNLTTTTTTTRTYQPGAWFVSGPCDIVDRDGKACVTSPRFTEPYGEGLSCSLSIFGGVERYLDVDFLDEQSGYRADVLRMDGLEVTHHLDGLPIGSVTWSSDDLTSVGGRWRLCALDAPRLPPGSWEIQGPCPVDPEDSACVMSPGFPGSYGSQAQSCTMSIYGGAPRRLEIQRLDMETGFPPLFMRGQAVYADRAGELIEPVLVWNSADTGTSSVWKVCARGDGEGA